ncbi:MAG TPA: GNAT family N-acetyltransferase [Thermoleophilaceae bacterium]|nr:GNAT family N-acetyltransferase [Thermoleophilaceae bacterium]
MFTLTPVGTEALDELKPLFLALRRHHGEVAPHLGELWSEEESWVKRRSFYEKLIEGEDAIVLVAREDGGVAGHAVATIDAGSMTWRHPEKICWVHDLVVLPEHRGKGIGEALVKRLWQESGVEEMRLAVVATNVDTIRFYERLGFETGPIHDLVSTRPL